MKVRKLIAVTAIAAVLPGAALAATTSTTFQVTALVTSACSVNAGNLDFGNYDPLSGTDDQVSSTINVTCTLLAPYTVRLNGGSVNASIVDREMDNGTHRLNYQLYSNAPRTTVWGDGTNGSTVTGAGLGPVSVPHTVYGSIPAAQNVSPGSYADTITVSVEF